MPRVFRRRNTRRRSNYSRGRRYRRRFRRSRLDSKFNRLSLQGTTVRMRNQRGGVISISANATQQNQYLSGVFAIPIVSRVSDEAIAAQVPLIVTAAWDAYRSIYDQFQLKWVNLKSVLISNLPASMRLHVSSDRMFNVGDPLPVPAEHPDKPNTLSMMLNPAQYNRVNYFLSATLMDEKITWMDTDMPGSTTTIGIPVDSGDLTGFRPAYFVQLESTVAGPTTVMLNLQFEYKIKFRSPRISSAAPAVLISETIDVPVEVTQ